MIHDLGWFCRQAENLNLLQTFHWRRHETHETLPGSVVSEMLTHCVQYGGFLKWGYPLVIPSVNHPFWGTFMEPDIERMITLHCWLQITCPKPADIKEQCLEEWPGSKRENITRWPWKHWAEVPQFASLRPGMFLQGSDLKEHKTSCPVFVNCTQLQMN